MVPDHPVLQIDEGEHSHVDLDSNSFTHSDHEVASHDHGVRRVLSNSSRIDEDEPLLIFVPSGHHLQTPNVQKRDSRRPSGLRISSRVSSTTMQSSNSSPASSMTSFLDHESRSQPKDILRYPVVSTHAYSYAHLSPNSLALRLNVLRRSLEIIKDHPKMLRSFEKDRSILDFDPQGPPRFYNSANNSSEDVNRKTSNASSAALAALMRPPMKRADSLPAQALKQRGDEKSKSTRIDDDLAPENIEHFIELLDRDNSKIAADEEIASTLYDLSLIEDNENKVDHHALRSTLLYALSTPFLDTATTPTNILGGNLPQTGGQSGNHTPISSFRLSATINQLTNLNQGNVPSPQAGTFSRPFHNMTLGKHALPQSVFSMEVDSPWSVKGANDLACLMFGVLKSTIISLTLMDLIAPQFRNFVTSRLLHQEDRNIILAGEIVAIVRSGGGDYAWTSMWAKRTGSTIICMFEQIPCDAFDILLLAPRNSDEPYTVKSIKRVAGLLVEELGDVHGIHDFCQSLAAQLSSQSDVQTDIPRDYEDITRINLTRYYTIRLKSHENIPCAITSNPVELHDDKWEVKLKLHSLPYIAGMFVLDAYDHRVLSCNNAIAKNLFGISANELVGNYFTTIVPKFDEILLLGLSETGYDIHASSGLVLPEHFFRRYDARRRVDESDNEEQLFFNSQGIEGTHRDGCTILVDVQLRTVQDTFVLWVTYSRKTKAKKNAKKRQTQITKLEEELQSPKRSSLNVSRVLENSTPLQGFSRSDVDLPSQLQLFPENESEILELGSSSTEVSRHNSFKAPKTRPKTLALPITHLGLPFNRTNLSEKIDLKVDTGSSPKQPSEHKEAEAQDQSSSLPPESAPPAKQGEITHKEYTEEELLQLENDYIACKKQQSAFWPVTVGDKRRTKKFSDFQVLKNLGEGAYGKVVLVQHRQDLGYKVILKCIDKERILVDTWVRDRKLGTIPSEIQIMSYLTNEPHPNIMRIIDFFEDRKYYYLETPIFGNPPAIDLFDFIEVRSNLMELECKFIFRQIVLAVCHLHKHGIAHRDIKDENVIVDENCIIKIIDFGSAGYTKLGPFDVFVGTIDYASPEVLRGEKYDGRPQDVWALGILLYTMLYKENPFYNVDEIMEGDLRIPYTYSDKCTNLIRRILVRDIASRPTVAEIMDDEWLRSD